MRPGVCVTWRVAQTAELRMVRVDVLDPDRDVDARPRLPAYARRRLESVSGMPLPVPVPLVAPVFAVVGAVVGGAVHMLLALQAGAFPEFAGAAVACAAGWGLLAWRSAQCWRTVMPPSAKQHHALTGVLEAHTLAVRQAGRPGAGVRILLALGAVRRLAWAAAELTPADRPKREPVRLRDVLTGDAPTVRPVPVSTPDSVEDAEALEGLRQAAIGLRARLAAFENAHQVTADGHDDDAGTRAPRPVTATQRRARARRVLARERAEAAGELARFAGEDLAAPGGA